MISGSMGRIGVFCSYAREDEALRARVEDWLAPLRADKIIDDWYDHRILPGQQWNAEIGAALDNAQLMLFIVTPDLMASSYIAEVELPKAIEREIQGKCQVVPIMALKTDWEKSPLARFQALPGKGRWLDDYPDMAEACTEIVEGVRNVCIRIVDWSNPYKRSSVGDWNHYQHTKILPDGRQETAEGTEEMIAKSETEATLLVELAVSGQVIQQTMKVDLTQPFEDRIGDAMRQIGVEVPNDFEYSIGPAQYTDEVLNVGGRRYETTRAERALVMGQRGQSLSGTVKTWRCMEVPLWGVVKGESDMSVMRQHQILLGFGHSNAATAKPKMQGVPAGSCQDFNAGMNGNIGQVPPPMAGFCPGRWLVQMNAYGVGSAFDMVFYPNGMLQGQQMGVPMPVQQQGQWFFDPMRQLLTLQILASSMGMPVGQETVLIQFGGGNAGALFGQDGMGRQFQFQRTG